MAHRAARRTGRFTSWNLLFRLRRIQARSSLRCPSAMGRSKGRALVANVFDDRPCAGLKPSWGSGSLSLHEIASILLQQIEGKVGGG